MPTPIFMRERCVHIRLSRGSEYSSCANSTASRDSIRLGTGGEDVEDQLGAVEHLDVRRPFPGCESEPGRGRCRRSPRRRRIVELDQRGGVRQLLRPLPLPSTTADVPKAVGDTSATSHIAARTVAIFDLEQPIAPVDTFAIRQQRPATHSSSRGSHRPASAINFRIFFAFFPRGRRARIFL
jgi:hypothetical protein